VSCLAQVNDQAAFLVQFADNLKRLRLKRGLSQEGLAHLVDLHRAEVSLFERALREPRLGILMKLAGGLDVTVGELTDGLTWGPSLREGGKTGRFCVVSEEQDDGARPSDVDGRSDRL